MTRETYSDDSGDDHNGDGSHLDDASEGGEGATRGAVVRAWESRTAGGRREPTSHKYKGWGRPDRTQPTRESRYFPHCWRSWGREVVGRGGDGGGWKGRCGGARKDGGGRGEREGGGDAVDECRGWGSNERDFRISEGEEERIEG